MRDRPRHIHRLPRLPCFLLIRLRQKHNESGFRVTNAAEAEYIQRNVRDVVSESAILPLELKTVEVNDI